MMAQPVDTKIEDKLAREAVDNWEKHWAKVAAQGGSLFKQNFAARWGRFIKRSSSGELVCNLVADEIGESNGGWILEAGCGTGYVSLRMALKGHQVVLLDTSPSALAYAKKQAELLGIKAMLIQGSVFQLPFKEDIFSGCFNVGVLDHFGPEFRSRAAQEMTRVIKSKARIIVITNDARSLVHHRAMRHAKSKGIWTFGFKDAIYSLKESLQNLSTAEDVREYSRGFLSQFEFLHYFLPQNELCKRLFFRFFYLLTFPFKFINRLPGHYLVTVIYKR